MTSLSLSFIDEYSCCPLCGASQLRPEFQVMLFGQVLKWSRCTGCTLVFQNPRLSADSIHMAYVEMDYWGLRTDGGASAYRAYLEHDPLRIAHARRRLDTIHAVRPLSGGKLLDVGSATGFFGVAARERGFDVTCVEPSAEIAELGCRSYGLDFRVSTLEGMEIEPAGYDVITLWGTDSHFLHPLESFQKLLGGLKPGGLLCMNYQNFDHWIRRVFPGLKVGWNVMYDLTDRSFDVLMEKCGMTLLYRGLEWNRLPLAQVLRLLKLKAPRWTEDTSFPVPTVSIPLVVLTKTG